MANKKSRKEEKPFFPFEKTPYQTKKGTDKNLNDYSLDSSQELDLGESELRKKHRSLKDERNPGHEP